MYYLDYLPPYLNNKYIQSLIIVIAFLFLAKIILFVLKNYMIKLTAKTKTDIDDLIIERIKNPVYYILLFIGIKIALIQLNLPENFSKLTNNIMNSIVIIIITYIVIVIFSILIDGWGKEWAKRTKSTMDDAMVPLFHKFSNIVVWIFGLLYVLRLWGVEIGPFLASLGIAGLAIGFAVKDSLSNIFGGIQLILDKNIKVGDAVKLDSGETGKILDIGIRTTKVRTWNNEVMIIPNGKLANSTIVNYAKPDLSARHVIKFGVEYGTEPEKVKKIALKVIKSVKEIVDEPESFVRFKEMADFSLNFKLYFWVSDYKQRFMVEDIVMTKLYRELNKAKINIPFPTRTIYMHKKKK